MLNFNKYEVLSFDCYGTLIDWETGIIAAIRPVLSNYNILLGDEQILELYAEIEAKIEKGKYVEYREVLRKVMLQFGNQLGFVPSASELDCLVESLRNWLPFPDTVKALQILKKKYRLAIISNIDNDLFAFSAKHLKVKFDWVITAEQAKSYKPSLHNFKFAIDRIGVSPEKILHIAQSIYHDIIPAKKIGLSTVWVNRRKDKTGSGATLPARGKPDLEVSDLETLVSIMELDFNNQK
ncbi:Haloacetate dehalogenase H-2 [Candidatus Methanoperedenaceae archaeon GB50]|nr:Haloacetate dehalogenase H-2 [Candidatus Methanoperedenaceae archaeon GB50]